IAMARTRRAATQPTSDPGVFPIDPPIDPMLAKLADGLPEGGGGRDEPEGGGWLEEPKWDGFRAIVFKAGDRLYTQSRDLRPLDRYFPELHPAFAALLPARCVIDGEIVIAGSAALDSSSR